MSRIVIIKGFLCAAMILGAARVNSARDISGQVFIVTRGGQSIKLGLVEVLALDADKVASVVKEADEKTSTERANLKEVEEAAAEAEKALQNDLSSGSFTKYESAIDLEVKARQRCAYLSSSLYYSRLFPPPFARTKTDADGRFRLTVLDGKPIVLSAFSSRMLAESAEAYDWLVRVADDATEINLSNDNHLNDGSADAVIGEQYTSEQILRKLKS